MSKAEKYIQTWDNVDRKSYILLTRAHLEFLAEVAKYPDLIQGFHLQNAVWRYEMFWLPLCRKYGTMACDDWAAPLDIAWAWNLHMLAPASYKTDCIRLIKNAPNHRSKSGDELKRALDFTEKLWKDTYKEEPFYVDLTIPVHSVPSSWKSLVSYDFKRSSIFFMEFYYQVSLPHFRDESFLCEATKRYVRYLDLLRRCPDLGHRPPLDVQLIMHSHQLNPIFYSFQAEVIFGKISDPDFGKEQEKCAIELFEVDLASRNVWDDEADLPYDRPGALYQGKPASLAQFSPIQPLSMASIKYTAEIYNIQVSNISPRCSYTLRFEGDEKDNCFETKISSKEKEGGSKPCSYHGNKRSLQSVGEDSNVDYLPLRDMNSGEVCNASNSKGSGGYTNPMFALQETDEPLLYNHTVRGEGVESEASPLGKIQLSTPHNMSFTVSLFETEDGVLRSKKRLIGTVTMDTMNFIASESKHEGIVLSGKLPETSISIEATLKLSLVSFGEVIFKACPEFVVENFSYLSNAMHYPESMVPPSEYNELMTPTEVTTYPVYDHKGNIAFSCRVIRSLNSDCRLFGLEVLIRDAVIATSHVLQDDALPRKRDLKDPAGCVYFDPDEGDYAMLIRGQKDWGVCIGRRIDAPQVAQCGSSFLGLKFFSFEKNEFCYVRKYKDAMYFMELTLKDGDNATMLIDLEECRISMSRDAERIPEAVALFFSILLLRYLACEGDRESWVILEGNGLELFTPFQSEDAIGAEWDEAGTESTRTNVTTHFISDSWGHAIL